MEKFSKMKFHLKKYFILMVILIGIGILFYYYNFNARKRILTMQNNLYLKQMYESIEVFYNSKGYLPTYEELQLSEKGYNTWTKMKPAIFFSKIQTPENKIMLGLYDPRTIINHSFLVYWHENDSVRQPTIEYLSHEEFFGKVSGKEINVFLLQ